MENSFWLALRRFWQTVRQLRWESAYRQVYSGDRKLVNTMCDLIQQWKEYFKESFQTE